MCVLNTNKFINAGNMRLLSFIGHNHMKNHHRFTLNYTVRYPT